jgi:hypothetical protein
MQAASVIRLPQLGHGWVQEIKVQFSVAGGYRQAVLVQYEYFFEI